MLRKNLLLLSWIVLNAAVFARSIPFPNFERTLKITDRLMAVHKVEGEEYSILRQTLAYNVANFFEPKDLYLADFQTDSELAAKLSEANFWAEKLHRDLSVPYTNADVDRRLSRLQEEVNFFLKYLRVINYNESPLQLYVYGSIAKGRFGGNSDLDIYIDSSDKDLLRRLENGIYRDGHPMFVGYLEVLTSNFEPANILDPLLPVSFRELRNLRSLYNGVLRELGFELTETENGIELVRTPIPPRMAIEFNPIEDRIFYLTMKSNQWLQDIADQFTALRANAGSTAKRTSTRLKSTVEGLIRDWKEVEADLQLILKDEPSARLWKIRKVVDPQSWVKMKSEGLIDYMLQSCQKQSSRLQKTLDRAWGAD